MKGVLSLRLDKDKIKESLEKDDIERVINSLNGSYHNDDRMGNPTYSTICHGGDSHKLYYYSDSHALHCYTNCGHMDIYELVIKAKASQGFTFTFPEALKYVAETTGIRIITDRSNGEKSDIVNDFDWIEKVTQNRRRPDVTLPSYNEHVLDVFMPYLNSWIDEGITKDIADEYKIGYYFKENQIVIPHYCKDGRLVGIRSRNTDERAEMGMKYIPTTVGGTQYRHVVSHNLYGLWNNKESIKRSRKIMFLEGEKSVLKCEGFYGEDNFTVAVSGSSISSIQRDLVLNLGVGEVFIAFDKHADGATEKQIEVYKQRLLRLARMFTPYCRTYILWCEDDLLDYNDAPVDKGKEVFEELMRKKYKIETYDTGEDYD